MIINPGLAPLQYPYPQAAGEKKRYVHIWRPPVWQADTLYEARLHAVVPSDANGYYYLCKSSGKSGGHEPVWQGNDRVLTFDKSARWQAFTDTSMLNLNDYIMDSTWTTNSGTIEESNYDGQTTFCSLVNPTVGVQLVNTVSIMRNTGETSIIVRTLNISVSPL
jgi:hypothetical protein